MFSADDLMRVRSGALSFDTFAVSARPDFVKLAQSLATNVPVWIEAEDLAHTMIMTVPNSLRLWRPSYPIKRFVVFRACAAARRHIKRGQDYRAFEARLDRPEERLEAVQDRVFEAHERSLEMLELLPRTEMQRAVMRSLMHTMCVDKSVRDLIKDPRTRVMFAADDDLVRMKVRRVMAILAERAEEIQQAK